MGKRGYSWQKEQHAHRGPINRMGECKAYLSLWVEHGVQGGVNEGSNCVKVTRARYRLIGLTKEFKP